MRVKNIAIQYRKSAAPRYFHRIFIFLKLYSNYLKYQDRLTHNRFKNFSIFYVVSFLIPYAIVPYFFINNILADSSLLMGTLALVSVSVFLIALNTYWGKTPKVQKIIFNFDRSIKVVFTIFILIVCVILITAPSIPFIESLRGADKDSLQQYREDFLKGRQGWEASLRYLIGIITDAILPYFIAMAFLRNHKHKFLYALIFLLYCISFLEKAYFLKLAIPLFFIYLFNAKNKLLFIIKGSVIIIGLIATMYFFAGSTYEDSNQEAFLTLSYQPSGPLENIFWRTITVPIITALDALRVFTSDFKGHFFYGSTSSFIAFLTGQNWTNYDKYIYQYQFGGAETGGSNSTYLIEAYINFGMMGIIFYSLIVGRLIRFVIKMGNLASVSVLPLFIINLFSASLVGTLLSGGFLFFFLMIKFIKFK